MERQEAIKNHRLVWNKIAELIESGVQYKRIKLYKYSAIKELGLELGTSPEFTIHFCYCCECSDMDCDRCPIVWRNGDLKARCYQTGIEFEQFSKHLNNEQYDRASVSARIIANLPEREFEDGN